MKKRIAVLVWLSAGALILAACSNSNISGPPLDEGSTSPATATSAASSSSAPPPHDVVVATHDSWAAPDDLMKSFDTTSGFSAKIETNGDAGELTNKLVLTKDSPIADAVYGIDNTFATRAVDAGVLQKYRSPAVTSTQYDVPGGADYLTPIDWGDVCVNVDDTWFTKHKIAPPQSLDDLIKPAYKGLFVTAGAATSSPG